MKNEIEVMTRNEVWQRILSANTAAVSFAAQADSLTAPVTNATTGLAMFSIKQDGQYLGVNNLMFKFCGTGANNNVLEVKIYGYRHIDFPGSTIMQYTPTLLADITGTVSSNVTGVATGPIDNTNLYCDTLVLGTGFNSNVSVEIVSPANDADAAYCMVDVRGFHGIGVAFKNTSTTNANGIYRGM